MKKILNEKRITGEMVSKSVTESVTEIEVITILLNRN